MRKLLWVARNVSVCLLAFLALSGTAKAQTKFGSINLGSSTNVTVLIPIDSAGTLSQINVVTQGASGLDFTRSAGGTCTITTAYPVKSSCSVTVTFGPKFSGIRYGAVVLSSATGVLGTAYLTGIGLGPQATFLPGAQTTVDAFTNNFSWVSGVVPDGIGNLYVTGSYPVDNLRSYLYKETLSNGIYSESIVPTSALNAPGAVAIDGSGSIYVADTANWRVLKETPLGATYSESNVVTFPAVYAQAPVGVAVDSGGNVYVSLEGTIYKETPTTTGYAQSTVVSGLPTSAGIAVDGSGIVYIVVNETYGWVVKATPSGSDYTQTTIPVSGVGVPTGVAVDGTGSLYVVFTGGNDVGQVFKETPTAGGYTQSTIPTTGLNQPGGITVDASGNVFVADSAHSRIVKENLADPPALNFAPTPPGLISADSPQTVNVTNIGNAELKFSALSYPADFLESAGISGVCTASTLLPGSETCFLPIDFKPQQSLGGKTSQTLIESVKLTTDTLNTTATPAVISVSGTETAPVPASTPTFTPPPGTYTSDQSVAIHDLTPGATIYYTTNGSTPTTSSAKYVATIPIAATETLKAIATAPGYMTSAVASALYTIEKPAATPVLSLPSGIYTSLESVSITDATPESAIYFTTNGTIPTSASAKYTAPIPVNTSQTLLAVAVAPGDSSSAIAKGTYTLVGSPTALSGLATAISTPNATLNAEVNTLGLSGSYLFQYGTSSSTLTTSTTRTALPASAASLLVSARLTTLRAKTRYYYQVVVTTAGGTSSGAIQIFTTN